MSNEYISEAIKSLMNLNNYVSQLEIENKNLRDIIENMEEKDKPKPIDTNEEKYPTFGGCPNNPKFPNF